MIEIPEHSVKEAKKREKDLEIPGLYYKITIPHERLDQVLIPYGDDYKIEKPTGSPL